MATLWPIIGYPPGSTSAELMTVSDSGSVLRRLTLDGDVDRAPAWSPTGGAIAWSRWTRDSRGRVQARFWIADTSGATARRLADGAGSIDWSPDARTLAFSAPDELVSHLYRVPADGGDPRPITE